MFPEHGWFNDVSNSDAIVDVCQYNLNNYVAWVSPGAQFSHKLHSWFCVVGPSVFKVTVGTRPSGERKS